MSPGGKTDCPCPARSSLVCDAAGNLNLRTNNGLLQFFQVDRVNELANVSRPLTVP